MIEFGIPALIALFVWWFGTGVVLYLDGLPARTFKWTMSATTALTAAALWGLAVTADDTSLAGVYAAFMCGVLVWAWLEVSFYTGYVTGLKRPRCPEGCRGWAHFGHAIQVSLWHELAILALAAVVAALTWGAANTVGLWTFVILWWMHQSARLNVFLGVRNLNEEWIPDHLAFLRDFLTQKSMNLLFPISVTVSTVAFVLLVEHAATVTDPAAAVGTSLLAALMFLAIAEHWFLMLPVPFANLWRWSLRSRDHDRERKRDCVQSHPRAANDETAVTDTDPAPMALMPADLQSWSTPLNSFCDADELGNVLNSIAAGSYGDVEQVKGIARTGNGWVHFDLAGGRPSLKAISAGADEQPRVVAIGRGVDTNGLEAAFEGCAAVAA